MANPKRKFHPLPLPSFLQGKLLVSGRVLLSDAISGILDGREISMNQVLNVSWRAKEKSRWTWLTLWPSQLSICWMLDQWLEVRIWSHVVRITLGDNSPHRPVIFHHRLPPLIGWTLTPRCFAFTAVASPGSWGLFEVGKKVSCCFLGVKNQT